MMKQKEIRDMEKRAERLNAILKEQKAEFHVVYYRNWKNNVAHEGYVNPSLNPCLFSSFVSPSV